MIRFLARRWFLIGLVILLGIGFGWPTALGPVASAVPQTAVVFGVMLLMSLALDRGDLVNSLQRPGPVLLATGINAGLLPMAAWATTPALPGPLADGMLIAAAVPCTMASATAWTRQAGGSDAVATVVTFITNLGCFLIAPAWLWLTTGAEVALPAGEMIARLALVVVVPTLAGQALRLAPGIGPWGTRHKVLLGTLAQAGILAMVFVGAVKSGRELAALPPDEAIAWYGWGAMFAAVVAVHVAMLAAGHAMAWRLGMSRPDRIAVGFAGSQKTLMVGVDIAAGYFSPLAMLPMVTYHVAQLLIDTVVVDYLRRPRSNAQP